MGTRREGRRWRKKREEKRERAGGGRGLFFSSEGATSERGRRNWNEVGTGRCDVREGGGVKRESYGREERKDGGKREGNMLDRAAQGCSAGERESRKSDGQSKLPHTPFAGGVLRRLIERCCGYCSDRWQEKRKMWPK